MQDGTVCDEWRKLLAILVRPVIYVRVAIVV
jgi:hypothetical protein